MFFQKKISKLMRDPKFIEDAEKMLERFYIGCEEAKQNGEDSYSNIKYMFANEAEPWKYSTLEVVAVENLIDVMVDKSKFSYFRTQTKAGDNLKHCIYLYAGWEMPK